MSRLAITLARFCFSGWVGAAALFVINGVQQVTFPGFDATVRGHLVLLRFPAYYALGFGLVLTGTLATAVSRASLELPRGRWIATLWLALAALGTMWVDFLWVYHPLAAMLTPPGAARPAEFETYHRLSEVINTLHVGLVLCAAMTVSLPRDLRGGSVP